MLRVSNDVVESNKSKQDEESIYLQGKEVIYQLYEVENSIKEIIERNGDHKGLKEFYKMFLAYKGQIISSIEIPTVDLEIGKAELTQANNLIINMDHKIEKILDESHQAINFSVKKVISQSKKGEREIVLSLLLPVLFLALAHFVARRFTKINQDMTRSLKAIVDSSLDGVIIINQSGIIEDYNSASEEIFGFTKAEAIGTSMTELIIPAKFREMHNAGMTRYLKSGESNIIGKRIEIEALHKQGHCINIELAVTSHKVTKGTKFCAFIRDITANKLLIDQQTIDLKSLKNLIKGANAPIIGLDSVGRITLWNDAAEQVSGYSRDEVIGTELTLMINNDSKNLHQQMLVGKTISTNEMALTGKNDNQYQILVSSSPQYNEQGNIVGYILVGQDVTELNRTRKDFEEKLAAAADQDVLTGLPNRRYLSHYLEGQLLTLQGNNQRGAVLFLDLDRFKLVNDSLGHYVGDQLLKVVAQRLRHCVRTEDLVCRLGGDEFVVLMPLADRTIEQTGLLAEKIARDIDRSITQPIQVDSHRLNTHASVGICHFDANDNVEDIINRADNAMYLAKADPTTHYALYTNNVHQVFVHKMRVLDGMSIGLVSNQFYMDYQPQFNHLNELIGLESLVRWKHPQLGNLSPDQFITLAEQNFRINELGTWVIDSVFRQVQQWAQEGFVLPKVAINVSSLQLLEGSFSKVVNRLAEQYGINPKAIVFEITESSDVEQFTLISQVLESLKSQGYRFSLDDFGTGYASMTYFKRLPFSQVKIDQSFIADIETNKDSLAIAEGVETQSQLAILAKLGCAGYQGYLFSKSFQAEGLKDIMTRA